MLYKYVSVSVIFLGVFIFYFLSLVCFGGVFNKTIFHSPLVGYEMIVANSVLCASLAIYHLISNACLWNNLLLSITIA